MKLRSYALALACALATSLFAEAQVVVRRNPPQEAQAHVEINGIAAKVNDRVITKNQVNFLLWPTRQKLMARFPSRGPEYDKAIAEEWNKVLDTLIERRKLLDRTKTDPRTVDQQLVDAQIQREIREQNGGDENAFRERLKKCRLTMEGYRDIIREKLAADSVQAPAQPLK